MATPRLWSTPLLRLRARTSELSCRSADLTGYVGDTAKPCGEDARGRGMGVLKNIAMQSGNSVVSTTDRRDCGTLSCESVLLGGFALELRGRAPRQATP